MRIGEEIKMRKCELCWNVGSQCKSYLVDIDKPTKHVGQHLNNHVAVIMVHPHLNVPGSRPR